MKKLRQRKRFSTRSDTCPCDPLKESSVSTANDKEVKDLAKSLRDQERHLSEKIGERVAGGALQGVTSYGNREFDKKNEK